MKVKPWWVEMPERPTRKQVVAEAVAIIVSAVALMAAIFWAAL